MYVDAMENAGNYLSGR